MLGLLTWYVLFPTSSVRNIPGLASVQPSFFKILVCAAGVSLCIHVMRSSFVGITAAPHVLILDYAWPQSDVVVQVGEDTEIRSAPDAKNGRTAWIVISDKGKTYVGQSTLRKVSDEMAEAIRAEVAKEPKP